MKAGGWDARVLERELRDTDLIAWYRNPTGGPAALRVPYAGVDFDKSMYPDLIMFHQTDEGIRPSIVDPHGFHLKDAAPKLRGMAAYAEAHGPVYDRIDAVAELGRRDLMALDVKSETVRDANLLRALDAASRPRWFHALRRLKSKFGLRDDEPKQCWLRLRNGWPLGWRVWPLGVGPIPTGRSRP